MKRDKKLKSRLLDTFANIGTPCKPKDPFNPNIQQVLGLKIGYIPEGLKDEERKAYEDFYKKAGVDEIAVNEKMYPLGNNQFGMTPATMSCIDALLPLATEEILGKMAQKGQHKPAIGVALDAAVHAAVYGNAKSKSRYVAFAQGVAAEQGVSIDAQAEAILSYESRCSLNENPNALAMDIRPTLEETLLGKAGSKTLGPEYKMPTTDEVFESYVRSGQ